MKTAEQINNVLKRIPEYQNRHFSHTFENALSILPTVLVSTEEEIIKYYNYLCEKVGPVYLVDDREILKEKQEDFYNKNLKGKSRTSKKYKELYEEWDSMSVLEYNELLWDIYSIMCWVMDDKSNPAYYEVFDDYE